MNEQKRLDGRLDLATSMVFSDDPDIPGSTLIRATHVIQLRSAVGAVRDAAGLPAYQGNGGSVVAGTTLIKAEHFTELRAALDQARVALSVPITSFPESLLPNFTPVRAIHVQELRDAIK